MKTKSLKWLNSKITDETTKAELDIIEFIKLCVREMKVKVAEEKPKVDWLPMFETLWKIYPRKIGKQNAIKQFEHKVRGLTEDECRQKCNAIYLAEVKYINQLKANDTPLEYTKHFASWLNSEVKNSPKYKGR